MIEQKQSLFFNINTGNTYPAGHYNSLLQGCEGLWGYTPSTQEEKQALELVLVCWGFLKLNAQNTYNE